MCIRDRVKGDLGDASVVYPLLMKGNFDAVIHFAAFINVLSLIHI